MVGFSSLPDAGRLGTLVGSGSAPPARFRATTARAGDGDEDKGPRLAGFFGRAIYRGGS